LAARSYHHRPFGEIEDIISHFLVVQENLFSQNSVYNIGRRVSLPLAGPRFGAEISEEDIMQIINTLRKSGRAVLGFTLALAVLQGQAVFAQSLDIPTKAWGISFGNSKEFSGLRFNFRDSRVKRVMGINVTFWQPRKDNKGSVVKGISLGLIPGGGDMTGIQLGILGPAAEKKMVGLNIGLIGAGSGEDMTGINIGGLGMGAGENLKGLNIGGLGAGAGKNVTGITIGGLGAGAGKNVTGLTIGGLGAGAGDNLTGITIGGLGAGAGENVTGLTIGGVGAGAGEILRGITIAGIGAGAGKSMSGLTICGVAAGAPEVRGLVICGIGTGGVKLTGAFLAGIIVKVERNGRLSGLALSSFNHLRGTLNGLSIGIVNYAWTVEKGLQIGIVNIIRDNPKGLKVLPVFNTRF
jgi:hypothetical protein